MGWTWGLGEGARKGDGRGVLRRLVRDRAGNTLAIVAAALVPLCAMVGSGVDMSRAYMAQNRLRQACDAGALAGRRMLTGLQVTPAIQAETTNYFSFNFPQNQFQSDPYTLSITVPTAGTLAVSTATRIPTTIMKMFGFTTLPISASCQATQDFINTDIMMVFDLSGSMNCAPGTAGNCGGVEQSGSKIAALRSAATSLYDTLKSAQDQLHDNDLRMRFGFVNYSSAVNVGDALYRKNPSYLVTSWAYQSRWGTEPVDVTTMGINGQSACGDAYNKDDVARSKGYTGFAGGYWGRSSTGPQGTYDRGGACLAFAQRSSDPDGYSYGRSRPQDVTGYTATLAAKTTWDASFYLGTPDGSEKPDAISTRWAGCIEERKTDAAAIDGGTGTSAPATAWDLDIDRVPNAADGDDSRWKPMWPEMVYWPETMPSSFPNGNVWNGSYWESTQSYYARKFARTHPDSYCPTASVRLTEYYNNRAAFVNYLNGLTGTGSTYHDLGMIWGARFLSPGGIFKAASSATNNQGDPDNPERIRGFAVRKYIIFMTDGDLSPSPLVYSSYGVEALDGRVVGSPSIDATAQANRHLQRFRMACNAAKAKGMDVWVIAFATTLTADMQNCATRPSQASGLATQGDLIAKFQEIGTKIGSLRLSQ